MLSKLKNDIIFYSKDGERVCSYNECRKKFELVEEEFTDTKGVTWLKTTHVCKECGREYQTKPNKNKSVWNHITSKHKKICEGDWGLGRVDEESNTPIAQW